MLWFNPSPSILRLRVIVRGQLAHDQRFSSHSLEREQPRRSEIERWQQQPALRVRDGIFFAAFRTEYLLRSTPLLVPRDDPDFPGKLCIELRPGVATTIEAGENSMRFDWVRGRPTPLSQSRAFDAPWWNTLASSFAFHIALIATLLILPASVHPRVEEEIDPRIAVLLSPVPLPTQTRPSTDSLSRRVKRRIDE